MRKFDYGFLKNDMLPKLTFDLLNSFEVKYGKFKALLIKHPTIFNQLVKIAIIQSVKSSNAIEGIITTDKRIKMLVENKIEPKNHNEKEIVGYKNALSKIHEHHDKLTFNNNDILNLHKELLESLSIDYSGKFKTDENVIVEVDYNGMRRIRFKPVSVADTPIAMEQLYLAYLDASCDCEINRLLLIPCYILDFLCIHPFSDGNGRMSRLLTTLALYKSGYNFVKYISYENQIDLYKNDYYEALKYSSAQWHENLNNYYYFIDNFLLTLIRTLNEIENRFNILAEKVLSKEERIKQTILSSVEPISKKDLLILWPDISISTMDKKLIKLQKDGIIVKVGLFKDAKYCKKI